MEKARYMHTLVGHLKANGAPPAEIRQALLTMAATHAGAAPERRAGPPAVERCLAWGVDELPAHVTCPAAFTQFKKRLLTPAHVALISALHQDPEYVARFAQIKAALTHN